MGGNKSQQPKEKTKSESTISGSLTGGEAVNAVVQQFVGRTGARGEITQVICKILSGSNRDRTIRRNVKGPIRIGDLLSLRETEIEARRIRTNQMRSS